MRHLTYSFGGYDEQLLAFGPKDAAQRILIIPPLFDEMNRMRRTLVETMRMLSNADVASAILDLPGCNESAAKLKDQSIDGWKEAVVAACSAIGATHILSVRGGCLIDNGPQLPIMRLSPAKAASLLKMMMRARIAGDKEAGKTTSMESLTEAIRSGPVELAGHLIGPKLWAGMGAATPQEAHDAIEIKPDDISGSPLWLRAEPQHDGEMAAGLATALTTWCKTV